MLMPQDAKIYLYLPPTDMRKSIDTLCVMISEVLAMNPTEGHLFLFRSRDKGKLKALYYEQNSFTLWYRRLEKGKFVFPRDTQGKIELSLEHFKWILSSDKFTRSDTKEIKYEKFY